MNMLEDSHKSNVLMNFFIYGSSSPPPSGSTASIHRAIAIVCFTSFEFIHTLPFTPTATSRGNREPRSGRRKCLGSKSLLEVMKGVRLALKLGLTVYTSEDYSAPWNLPSTRQTQLPFEFGRQNIQARVPCLYAQAKRVHIQASWPIKIITRQRGLRAP